MGGPGSGRPKGRTLQDVKTHLLGVDIRISCAKWFHELTRKICACSRANEPGLCILKKLRVHALRKSS